MLTTERAELAQADAVAVNTSNALAVRRRQLLEAQSAAGRRYRQANSTLEKKDAVDECLARRPIREAELTEARAVEERVRLGLRELEGQRLVDADGRITALRGALVELRSFAMDPITIARAALERDDQAVALAVEVPKKILDACGELGAAERARRQLENQLASINQSCAQAPLMEAAAQEQETAASDLARLDRELLENASAQSEVVRHVGAIGAIDAEVATIRAEAQQVAALERAEAALEELTPQEAQLQAQSDATNAELMDLGPPPEALPTVDVAHITAEISQLETVVRNRRALIERRSQQVETMQGALKAAEEMGTERAARYLQLSDWQRLTLDLGKDGLQAALSDAALPEFVALTNTLLHTSFGPRFTVDVRSQKGDSTGKRMLETLDVMVIDTGDPSRGIAGREALAETYSGGELAIIGEALSLALTVLACRSSDGTPPTLVRDEAGAALDPVNGRAWIAMLRRAVDMVGADRLLFVSHSPELTALADSTIDLGARYQGGSEL